MQHHCSAYILSSVSCLSSSTERLCSLCWLCLFEFVDFEMKEGKVSEDDYAELSTCRPTCDAEDKSASTESQGTKEPKKQKNDNEIMNDPEMHLDSGNRKRFPIVDADRCQAKPAEKENHLADRPMSTGSPPRTNFNSTENREDSSGEGNLKKSSRLALAPATHDSTAGNMRSPPRATIPGAVRVVDAMHLPENEQRQKIQLAPPVEAPSTTSFLSLQPGAARAGDGRYGSGVTGAVRVVDAMHPPADEQRQKIQLAPPVEAPSTTSFLSLQPGAARAGDGQYGSGVTAQTNKHTPIVAVLAPEKDKLVPKEDVEAIVQERLKKAKEEAEKTIVVASASKAPEGRRKISRSTFLIFSLLFLALVAISVALGLVLRNKEEEDVPTLQGSSIMLPPTLQAIQERGSLRCRVRSEEVDIGGHGFTIDLCHALAAAVFNGDIDKAELLIVPWSEQWSSLRNGTLDVAFFVTSNMQRDILEPTSGVGFSFSTPYIYTGTVFAGHPEYVKCAEDAETLLGICRDLRVCVLANTTTLQIVQNHLDDAAIRAKASNRAMFEDFAAGLCNTLASEPFDLPQQRARDNGYTGVYVYSSTVLSKEPLAIMTRDDDPEFAEFCNWVLRSLFAAEAMGITRDIATEFPTTTSFGDMYQGMFQHAIAAIGNYGEFYSRNFEEFFSGRGSNQINNGTTGLLYVPPLGILELEDASNLGAVPNGTLESIEVSQTLRCGYIVDPSILPTEHTWLDIEYCKGIAAGLFSPSLVSATDIIAFPPDEGFEALKNGEIDILAGAPVSMEVDVVGDGVSFSPPYFYSRKSNGSLVALSLATRQDDDQWSDFVRWIVYSTMYGEEVGFSSGDADKMPSVDLFGPKYHRMFQYVILALGNYKDIYERTLGAALPRSGPNVLNDGQSPLLNPYLSSFF